MRRYDLADAVSLRREVRDLDGELTAAVTVTLLITKPSGETYAPTVVPDVDTDGYFDATVPPAEIDEYGPYEYAWTVTGAVDDISTGQFYVGELETARPPLGSFERLSRKIGYTPADAERDRAEHLLDEASELIRDVAGKTWLDADGALESVPFRVALVCVAAAYRAFENPQALTQRSIGDSSKSFDRTGLGGGEDVYLTPDEIRTVRAAAGASTLTVVTMVSPYSGEDWTDTEEIVWAS